MAGGAVRQGFVHEAVAVAVDDDGVGDGAVGDNEAFFVVDDDDGPHLGLGQLDDGRPDGVCHVVDGGAVLEADIDAVTGVAFGAHGPGAVDGVTLVLLAHFIVAFEAAAAQDDTVLGVDGDLLAVLFEDGAGDLVSGHDDVLEGGFHLYVDAGAQAGVHDGGGEAGTHGAGSLAEDDVGDVAEGQFGDTQVRLPVRHEEQDVGGVEGVEVHRDGWLEVGADLVVLPLAEEVGVEGAGFYAAAGGLGAGGVEPVVGVAVHAAPDEAGAVGGEEVHGFLTVVQEGVDHFVGGAVADAGLQVLASEFLIVVAAHALELLVTGNPHHACGLGGGAAPLVGFFGKEDFESALGGGKRCAEACCAGSNYDDVIIFIHAISQPLCESRGKPARLMSHYRQLYGQLLGSRRE